MTHASTFRGGTVSTTPLTAAQYRAYSREFLATARFMLDSATRQRGTVNGFRSLSAAARYRHLSVEFVRLADDAAPAPDTCAGCAGTWFCTCPAQ
jgi:hypothetical protein